MRKEQHTSPAVGLSDEAIIEGLRNRDPKITRDYFYGFCCIDAKKFNPENALSFASQIPPTMEKDYSNRITPEYITSLKSNEIFVFGSNLAGMHGGGAARTARLYFGAVMGNGDGPQGQSYAIPTMQGGVETIRPYVNKFIDYAKVHPEQTFLVTPIGCGIAGFTPDEIAPLFEEAVSVENIHLPQNFWEKLV